MRLLFPVILYHVLHSYKILIFEYKTMRLFAPCMSGGDIHTGSKAVNYIMFLWGIY